MAALITTLITAQDTAELVRDQIALILLVESTEQQRLAAIRETAVTYTRAGSSPSDYTVAATQDTGKVLVTGTYTVTAGTLTAGHGTWTATAPGGATETCTTTTAAQNIAFPGFGLTPTTTVVSVYWKTGDVVSVAVSAARDPLDWALQVYTERSNPWAKWVDGPAQDSAAAAPIVSVSLDTETDDEKRGSVVSGQQVSARFNIDCYGYGASTATDAGHDPGDARAAIEARRAVRLVRQILMAGHYVWLGMRGTVGKRWISNRQRFPPQVEAQIPTPNVVGWRVQLTVDFTESSPQVVGGVCELITSKWRRTALGQVIFETDQDFSA